MTTLVYINDEAYQLLERAAEKWGVTCDDLGTSAVLAGLLTLSILWAHDRELPDLLTDHLASNLHTGPLRFGPRPATRNA
jgi:hypothetical protein